MGNLSGESREQNRKNKVTRFRSVTYARQLAFLVNTLGSHLKCVYIQGRREIRQHGTITWRLAQNTEIMTYRVTVR